MRRPAHDVFGLGAFPQGEVGWVMLFLLPVQFAGGVDNIIQVASRKHAIMVVFVVFCHIEVHRTLAFVGISVFQDFLYQLDLLDDVSRSVRLDAGGSTLRASIALW